MNQIMTEKQHEVLTEMKKLSSELTKSIHIQNANERDLYEQYIEMNDVIESTINDDELFEAITDYKLGEFKDTAVITITNNISAVIANVDRDGKVFGYLTTEDKKFFLSDIEYNVSEEDYTVVEPFFTIGIDGMELSLDEAMRI